MTTHPDLAGKAVVVTGAGNGIGRAIAERFGSAGCSVAVNDVDPTAAAAVAETINSAQGTAIATPADVSNAAHVEAMFDTVVDAFGTVDVLLNNAGLVGPMLHFFDADEAWWRRIIDVNLTGHFLCCQRAARIMAHNGGGSIINMSSGVSSVKGLPNRYAYGATKAAVIGLTKAVAADFITKGIRCNAICPGTIVSPSFEERVKAVSKTTGKPLKEVRENFVARQPMARLGTAEEVAALAVFLASDESSYITGQPHLVDGGLAL